MAKKDLGYMLNYTNLYLIDITPKGPERTWARIGQGIQNVSPNDSKSTESFTDYASEGGTTNTVQKDTFGYQFTGYRCYGNAAQDFIESLRFKDGEDVVTNFKHIAPNGAAVVCEVAVTDISMFGGDANAKGDVSFNLLINGVPTFEDPMAGDDVPTQLSADAVTVDVGATAPIVLTAQPEGATTSAAFASSDVETATVDDAGNVTGVKAGSCKVSVKSVVKPSVVCEVEVTVSNPSVMAMSAKATSKQGA